MEHNRLQGYVYLSKSPHSLYMKMGTHLIMVLQGGHDHFSEIHLKKLPQLQLCLGIAKVKRNSADLACLSAHIVSVHTLVSAAGCTRIVWKVFSEEESTGIINLLKENYFNAVKCFFP